MVEKIIGFSCSSFDILHAGHMLMLEEAKSVCDYLIIGLQTDPTLNPRYRDKQKKKPIQSLEERRIMLKGIKYIDKIVEYSTEEDLYNLLKKLKPDIRIIGADWKGKKFTGYDLPIKVYFNSRNHNYSTTELRKRIYEAEKQKEE